MIEQDTRIQKLEKEGWTKRFIASEPRLSEVVELYRASDFDVHLEPIPKKSDCGTCAGNEEETECRVCFDGVEDQYRIIFTRPSKTRNRKK